MDDTHTQTHIKIKKNKKDNMWVRWVHYVYLKELNWWDYYPKVGDSWYWKVICHVSCEGSDENLLD